MAASTEFNYDIILSLDKAKLVKRKRLNFLGSKELTLDYHLTGGGTKEEATEYLEANRLTLTDPKFGFKTYDGTWKCVDIEFNEDAKIIRQRFKIDSSLVDDVAERSNGGIVERDYYWRVVDPDAYNVPDTVSVGEVYTKTATDNGDGTYDVVISRKYSGDGTGDYVLDSTSYSENAFSKDWTELYKNSVEIDAQTWMGVQTYFTPVGTPGNYSVPVGFFIDIKNSPRDDGLFDATIFVSEAKQNIADYVFVTQTPVTVREKMGYNIPSADMGSFMAGTGDFSSLPTTNPLTYDIGMSGSINKYGLMDMRTTERND